MTVFVLPGVMLATDFSKFTVTVVEAETAVFAVEVALTVSVLLSSSFDPTVSKPLELMVVLDDVLPVTVQVTPWGTPVVEPSPVTCALYWRVSPAANGIVAVVETVTVSANGFTVIVLVPTTALLALEVALIVSVPPVFSSELTVNKPLVLMVVLEDVLPDTVQVTPWGTLVVEPSPVTVALN